MISLALCLVAAPMATAEGSMASARPAPLASARVLGAWGAGPFENDAAADWFARFVAAPSWLSIRRAFAETTRPGHLEVDDASVAVAAAAVVSAAQRRQFEALPPEGRLSAAALGAPPAALLQEAATALARVQGGSELADLWAEGDAAPWLASLDAIRAGLT